MLKPISKKNISFIINHPLKKAHTFLTAKADWIYCVCSNIVKHLSWHNA